MHKLKDMITLFTPYRIIYPFHLKILDFCYRFLRLRNFKKLAIELAITRFLKFRRHKNQVAKKSVSSGEMGISVLLLFLTSSVFATEQAKYYRTFWNPQYHAKSLDYCLYDKKQCGQVVANSYCQTMGYDESVKYIIAYDVGVTNYFQTCVGCKGWNCKSFKQITCVAKHLHQPIKPYYFRSRIFVYPRLNHYRIDWCYQQQQGCGARAAFSFCRRMGYSKAKDYKKEHVDATRALGNQRLCFGEQCHGFKSITCYR